MRIILAILFSILTAIAGAKTIDICPTCAISSIQAAVIASESFDVIKIRKGIYPTHAVEITKPLTLIGDEGAVLDGQLQGEILILHADSVNILHLTFKNVGMSYTKDWAAISSDRVSHCRIENNQILNSFFGIYLRKSRRCRIINNTIVSNANREITSGNAIHLWHCDSMYIEGNLAEKHRDGIYFEFVKNSFVRSNISRNNIRYGLHFMFSDYNEYLQNTFENNGSGVAVMYSSNIAMKENKFINNWGPASYGLLLKEIKNGEISRNYFYHNTSAIYAEGALRMEIFGNRFESNGWAMKILSSCMDNNIQSNDFISNSFSVFTNSPRNYNSFHNNHWSNYTGYDLDRDGIGDVPHRPVSIFTYIVETSEPTLLLLKSNFIALLELAEQAAPSITPEALIDESPRMNPIW